MTRSAMLEVLREDYVRTARAKGLFRKLIIRRHALRNALLPVVTIIGIEFAFLMGGLVVTEQVFNLNGLGKLFVESVTNHDYTMTQALVMLVVAIFVAHQPRGRHHLRVARSAHPLRVTGRRSWQRSHILPPRAGRSICRSGPSLADEPVAVLRAATRWAPSGAVVVVVMIVMAAFADFDRRPTTRSPTTSTPCWRPPSAEYWLGTDQFGRDVFSRIVYGARTALLVGFVSAFVGATIGLVLGVASAYFGGRFDLIFQRILDVLMAFPLIILALAVVVDLRHRHRTTSSSPSPSRSSRAAPAWCARARSPCARCPTSMPRAPAASATPASCCATWCPTSWRRS